MQNYNCNGHTSTCINAYFDYNVFLGYVNCGKKCPRWSVMSINFVNLSGWVAQLFASFSFFLECLFSILQYCKRFIHKYIFMFYDILFLRVFLFVISDLFISAWQGIHWIMTSYVMKQHYGHYFLSRRPIVYTIC